MHKGRKLEDLTKGVKAEGKDVFSRSLVQFIQAKEGIFLKRKEFGGNLT